MALLARTERGFLVDHSSAISAAVWPDYKCPDTLFALHKPYVKTSGPEGRIIKHKVGIESRIEIHCNYY